MKELRENGPVISTMRYYDDFPYYDGGIFVERQKTRLAGYYHSKVIGYGERVKLDLSIFLIRVYRKEQSIGSQQLFLGKIGVRSINN